MRQNILRNNELNQIEQHAFLKCLAVLCVNFFKFLMLCHKIFKVAEHSFLVPMRYLSLFSNH